MTPRQFQRAVSRTRFHSTGDEMMPYNCEIRPNTEHPSTYDLYVNEAPHIIAESMQVVDAVRWSLERGPGMACTESEEIADSIRGAQ